MTNSRIDALVATPPNEHRVVSLLNSRGEDAKVTLQSEPGRFCWTLKNLPEARYLLLYGCAAASTVKVNGKVLPRSAATVGGSLTNGWEEDPERNRLVILIPPYDVEHSDATAEIEVFLKGSKS